MADQTDSSGSAVIKTAATVSGQFTMEGFFLKKALKEQELFEKTAKENQTF